MPQERAPDALLGRVMASVAGDAVTAVAGRSPQLSLRPWELGAVAVLSLLLMAVIPLALSQGVLPEGVVAPWKHVLAWAAERWSESVSGAGALWRDSGHALDGTWRDLSGNLLVGSGAWMSWLCGVAAFAVAFYLLFTWRPAEPAEDAHA